VPFASNIKMQLTNGNPIIFHQSVGVDYLKALASALQTKFI
jgi:hypothetical protein